MTTLVLALELAAAITAGILLLMYLKGVWQ